MSLCLTVLPDEVAICRLPAGTPLPEWAGGGALLAVTWTTEETSVVCSRYAVPPQVVANAPWRALRIAGPLDFDLTGILLSIARPLADAEIGIFAVSTYDTDYVLVKQESLDDAVAALTAAGHEVR